ncbi:uncharacterized protein LOC118277529 [Spodoptera frugiperda]|uniref:Uncharacterized protein LOC118277529 n=1 Tax=Spodoptera frugiperda TaxID=7108 RepID=A0A9R0ERX9_SPOFR|nr:uncharacterized protein LOC118277529 [Spodoptera frugiperda]
MARCRCSCVEMRRFAARQCRVIMTDSGNMSIVDARPDTNQVIDVDQLICEIKKRPLLYTRAQTEYIQKVARQREWTEVCQALCKNFRQLSARKKREKVRQVQSKWFRLKKTFLRQSGYGVRTTVGRIRKKKQIEKLSFLIPTTPVMEVDSGAGATAAANNNDDDLDLVMDTLKSEEANAPTASTSADNIAAFAKQHEVKKKPFFIPLPKIEEPKHEPIDENLHFALMLVPLLRALNQDQRFYAWSNILNILQKARELGPKKLSILQEELRYTDGEAPNLLQDLAYVQPDPEPPVDEEPMFPAAHGRPTNEAGEIMYPETDTEDNEEA